MTGYQSKKAAAQDKLIELAKEGMGMHSPDAPEYIVCEALIEALAQPEQEPIAARPCRSCDGSGERYTGIDEAPTSICIPCKGTGQIVFAQPAQEPWPEEPFGHMAGGVQPAQEPKSVTYKEVQDSMNALEKGNLRQQVIAEELGQRKLYTATPAQPAQEPVALVIDGVLVKSALPEKYTGHLYTAPPQRLWVGLTDEELANLSASGLSLWALWRAIEAKLKEKNNV